MRLLKKKLFQQGIVDKIGKKLQGIPEEVLWASRQIDQNHNDTRKKIHFVNQSHTVVLALNL